MTSDAQWQQLYSKTFALIAFCKTRYSIEFSEINFGHCHVVIFCLHFKKLLLIITKNDKTETGFM